MADQDPSSYRLLVTAGPTYNPSTHTLLPVNTPTTTSITTPNLHARVAVRLQNYHGLPSNSPSTSPYFSHDPHKSDLYSIAFSFRLRDADIKGDELVFGNDFDRPIRDHLPPGFGTALRIVKWGIDPGMDGDVYADRPFMYGRLLSSINVLHVGDCSEDAESGKEAEGEDGDDDAAWTEGGTETGRKMREEQGIPADAAHRRKWFLDEEHVAEFEFEKGREYGCDFFNPYLDFNEFSLKLPGFTLPIMKYWDGQPLRYVLKHRIKDKSVDEPLLVIQFTLVPIDKVEEEEAKWAKNHTSQPSGSSGKRKQEGERPSVTGYVDEGVD